ncbi:hypothetical protein GIB67_041317 [Kingdonia uniflora]|uniref:Protein Iojap-related, mitochondrial n=1 Tax=Kingdonia uniflora TaxID=39325 RepID=A0A7J7NJA3_9MAGN|nr:hypothetical protein GIB67_041317 [Kingdonia uniflora]
MLATLRSLRSRTLQPLKLGYLNSHRSISSSSSSDKLGFLDLQEVETILNDVKADDVKVIPVNQHCDWTDFMVIATGRSTWHVRNIAQALIHKAGSFTSILPISIIHLQVKQKQKGAERILLPSVQGHEGGKWIVIDSGKIIIHTLDENARAYYNLESLWTQKASSKEDDQEELYREFRL